MKILYIKLVNFIGIHAARGLKEVEYDFSKIDKPIIQLYGPNRCGKTVLIQQLHPFSSINLSGDDRSDLSLILAGETGIKNIITRALPILNILFIPFFSSGLINNLEKPIVKLIIAKIGAKIIIKFIMLLAAYKKLFIIILLHCIFNIIF